MTEQLALELIIKGMPELERAAAKLDELKASAQSNLSRHVNIGPTNIPADRGSVNRADQLALQRAQLELAATFGKEAKTAEEASALYVKQLRALETYERALVRQARSADALVKSEEKLAAAQEKQAETIQQRIYRDHQTSEAEINALKAERQGYTNVASTQSEARRRELADPNTSGARRAQLELGGISGSFRTELGKGFFGTKDPGDSGSFGQSIGQVGRFTALYGGAYSALYQITNGFSLAAKEAIAFGDAVEDLNLASGKTAQANEALATSLGNIAASSGLAPSAGVVAGAQAIGLFGAAQSDQQVQRTVATTSVAVSSRIAAVGGSDLQQTQQDLAGLARSLNLSVDRLPALEDELTYVSRQIGRPVSELLPAVAQVGTLGAGAGFTPQELFAIIGQVTSTTGQSASGASSSFRQVLSRADDPNFQQKVQEQFGIDAVGKSLRDIFKAFSESNPDTKAINNFSLLFGRGASQQVAQILAGNFGQIEGVAQGAQAAAGTGIGQEVFNEVMSNFGGQLKILGAQILNLGKDLATTGILDFLGALVKGSLVLVEALDKLVQIFNEIPRPIRTVAFALIELQLAAAAFRAFGRTSAATNALGLVGAVRGGLVSTGREANAGILTRALFTNVSTIGRGAGGILAAPVAPLLGRGLAGVGNLPVIRGLQATGLGAAGAGALAGGIGVAAVIAVGVIKNLVENDAVRKQIQDAAVQIGNARDAEGAQAGLEAARQAQERAKKLTEPGFNLQTLTGQTALNALNVTGARDRADQANAQVAYAEGLTKQFETAQRNATSASAVNGITDFTNLDALTESVKQLGLQGYNASEQVDAVNTAFERLTAAAREGATVVIGAAQAPILGLQSGAGAAGALQAAIDEAGNRGEIASGGFGIFGGGSDGYNQIAGALRNVDPTALAGSVNQAVNQQLATLPKDESGNYILTDEAKANIILAAQTAADNALPPGTPDEIKAVFNTEIANAVRTQLNTFGQGAGDQPSISNLLSTQFGLYAANVAQKSQERGSGAQGQKAALGDIDRALGDANQALENLTPGSAEYADAFRIIRNYEQQRAALFNDYIKAANQEATLFSQLAASRLGADDSLGRDAIALRTAAANFGRAKKTGDKDFIAQAEIELNQARQKQAQDALASANAARLAAVDPRNAVGQVGAQLRNARATLGTLTPGSAEYSQTQQQINELVLQQRKAVADIANAQAAAGVAGNTSQLAQAKTSITVAKRNLSLTLKGTAEYYQALAELRDAQHDLGQAELAYASDLRKLNSDLTDPVAQARNAVKDARAQLRADQKSGQGKDVIAADRVNVRNAEAQAEQAAFQQRLSDAQIADQLGRTSHQAYIQYLQNEHDRLTAITHRTRQQQDQLDTIDQALLAANTQLQGQFNLGDIKVPTPYEVRRYIAEVGSAATSGALQAGIGSTAGSFAGAAGGGNQINYFTIDGADTAAVERILRQILSTSAITTATTKGRKKG